MADLFSDAFTYSNGKLHTANASWDTTSGRLDADVASNLIQPGGVGGSDSVDLYSGVTWPNDQYAYCSVVAATNSNHAVGVWLRGAIDTSGYRIIVIGALGAGATVQLRRYNATVSSGDLASKVMTVVANDVLKAQIVGYTIRAYINGTEITTGGFPYDDSGSGSKIASGNAGFTLYADSGAATDAKLDTWGGGDASAASANAPNVNESVTVTESVSMKMDLGKVNINDAVTVAEALTMHMPIAVRMYKP